MTEQRYVGIDEDEHGGMTHLGQIVKDARVFGFIPETETCAGWGSGQMQSLYERVTAAWDQYGHLPSLLPPDLQERHGRIYREALERARKHGWDPELGEDD
jgi:hypothetical protein